MARVLYIVGGPPRVGKSALGRRIMERHRVPWLSTDIIRTVLRMVDPNIDQRDRGHADPVVVADLMYPYLEQTVEVAIHQSERFLIEGVEWFPRHLAALALKLEAIPVRACFLGHTIYSDDDLTAYQGVNRWHDGAPEAERRGLPEWIRRWSDRLRTECAEAGEPYIDVGELGFQRAMVAAERLLLGEGAAL